MAADGSDDPAAPAPALPTPVVEVSAPTVASVICADPTALNDVIRVICGGSPVNVENSSPSLTPSAVTDAAIPVLGVALLALVYPALLAVGSGVLARVLGRRRRPAITA